MVEYTPGYLADHWCTKGHILLCVEGELHTELEDGRSFVLAPGMSYQVADHAEAHRSFTPEAPGSSSSTRAWPSRPGRPPPVPRAQTRPGPRPTMASAGACHEPRQRSPSSAPPRDAPALQGLVQEAALRMLMNNLDPDVAERPRTWWCTAAWARPRATGLLQRHRQGAEHLGDERRCWCRAASPWAWCAPPEARGCSSPTHLVPKWATWEHFRELDRKGLMMYGR